MSSRWWHEQLSSLSCSYRSSSLLAHHRGRYRYRWQSRWTLHSLYRRMRVLAGRRPRCRLQMQSCRSLSHYSRVGIAGSRGGRHVVVHVGCDAGGGDPQSSPGLRVCSDSRCIRSIILSIDHRIGGRVGSIL